MLEIRKNVAVFYKNMQDKAGQREKEIKKLFKDQLSGHVKVLEFELQKL